MAQWAKRPPLKLEVPDSSPRGWFKRSRWESRPLSLVGNGAGAGTHPTDRAGSVFPRGSGRFLVKKGVHIASFRCRSEATLSVFFQPPPVPSAIIPPSPRESAANVVERAAEVLIAQRVRPGATRLRHIGSFCFFSMLQCTSRRVCLQQYVCYTRIFVDLFMNAVDNPSKVSGV